MCGVIYRFKMIGIKQNKKIKGIELTKERILTKDQLN